MFLKVFFVLRKKQNQVTFLHVYHHTITAIFSWCYLKLLPGEQGVIVAFLNSIVHVIMYSYYFIASLGSKYRKYLWWKKYMTCIQLVIISQNIDWFAKVIYNLSSISLLSFYQFVNKIKRFYIFNNNRIRREYLC